MPVIIDLDNIEEGMFLILEDGKEEDFLVWYKKGMLENIAGVVLNEKIRFLNDIIEQKNNKINWLNKMIDEEKRKPKLNVINNDDLGEVIKFGKRIVSDFAEKIYERTRWEEK